MKKAVLRVLCLASVMIVGCSREAATPLESAPNSSTMTPAADGSEFRLTEEPSGATDVIAARESAKDDEDVVIVGRIGGDENPWVDGRGAFLIVDRSLLACSDREGDECAHPWDYCCELDKLPTSKALVKLVDKNGDLVKADARGLLQVKELQTVVVRGKARRNDDGNLIVLANGVFVKSNDSK